MAIQSRNVQISALNRRSLFITSIAIVLVVGLIFIPEIISIQSKLFGSRTQVGQDTRASLKYPAPAALKSQSPLDRVLTMLEAPSSISEAGSTATSASEPKVMTRQEADEVLMRPSSWSMLQSKRYADILVSARNRALVLSSQVKEDDVRAKYALLNFANGVSFVLSGPTKVVSAPDAFAYLESLQLKATRALEEDGVTRRVYVAWRDVSLDSSRALDKMKSSPGNSRESVSNRRFSIVLTDLKVRPRSTYIKVRGLVRGKGVRKIEVYRNGTFLSTVSMGREKNGFKPLFFRYHDGTGIFALRVVDDSGKFYERRFQFLTGGGSNISLNREYPFARISG